MKPLMLKVFNITVEHEVKNRLGVQRVRTRVKLDGAAMPYFINNILEDDGNKICGVERTQAMIRERDYDELARSHVLVCKYLPVDWYEIKL